MHETQQKIISLFKNNSSELSTSQILDRLDENYVSLRKNLGNKSKEDSQDTKGQIAKLHRKLLHHINKLVDLDILRLAKHGEKGEKFFLLNLADNEELVTVGIKKRILVSKPIMPLMPIEGYEHSGIVAKYEAATWIDRLNSVVLRCEKISSIKELSKILAENIFSCINDAICLEEFNSLINKEDVSEFVEKLSLDLENYGKEISIVVELSNIKNIENFEKFLNSIRKNIFIIFNIEKNDLQEYFKLFSKIAEAYSRNRAVIYIKNKSIHPSPYFLGRAGPYSIEEKDWISHETKDQVCVACTQSSIILDVGRFISKYSLNSDKFSELVLNISKSILSANSLQRRKSQDYFKSIISLNHNKEFLNISRNYIRFWNFGLSQEGINQDFVINLISEAKKKVDSFSRAEEIIYNSCGMPSRFKLAFSCAFKESAENISEAKYSQLEITNFEDFYTQKIKKEISAREIVSEIFNGGNDVTFHRLGPITPQEFIREISAILSTYRLPFFSYNFEKIKGDMKITSYFG
jgi:hypothetical protein